MLFVTIPKINEKSNDPISSVDPILFVKNKTLKAMGCQGLEFGGQNAFYAIHRNFDISVHRKFRYDIQQYRLLIVSTGRPQYTVVYDAYVKMKDYIDPISLIIVVDPKLFRSYQSKKQWDSRVWRA